MSSYIIWWEEQIYSVVEESDEDKGLNAKAEEEGSETGKNFLWGGEREKLRAKIE